MFGTSAHADDDRVAPLPAAMFPFRRCRCDICQPVPQMVFALNTPISPQRSKSGLDQFMPRAFRRPGQGPAQNEQPLVVLSYISAKAVIAALQRPPRVSGLRIIGMGWDLHFERLHNRQRHGVNQLCHLFGAGGGSGLTGGSGFWWDTAGRSAASKKAGRGPRRQFLLP